MDINVNQTTTINLSEEDVKNVISKFLKQKGYDVNTISFNIGTHYKSSHDQYGTEVLEGATVKANIVNKTEKI